MVDIKENLKKIQLPPNVKLVAVSKFHSVEEIICAIKCGQKVFGENRVQEAKEKFTQLYDAGYNPELHIIGTLQRNKVKEAVKIASMIESVDRIELIQEIEKQCSKLNKKIKILLEIHTGEDSKSGFSDIDELENALDLLNSNSFPHVECVGFMTMAPFTKDESLIRKSFKSLKKLQNDYSIKYSSLSLTELSMGMSMDYKIAIEEGSTMVRIGTAIFGERKY